MNAEKIIAAAKQGFEDSFSSGEFYNKQTRDSRHLNAILDFLPIKCGMRILDLGTGSGYLSFPIAEKYPDAMVVGLDIVEQALEANRRKAAQENKSNLSFVSYGGVTFPFEDGEFDMVVSRYSLHHFPCIQESVSEVSRVLKKGGFFFISDPAPNENDHSRFVDEYMQLKKDGHIKFYTKNEWENLCLAAGLEYINSFDSSIRFPKKKSTAEGFDELLKKHDKSVIESYGLEVIGDEIYITELVNNILFGKR